MDRCPKHETTAKNFVWNKKSSHSQEKLEQPVKGTSTPPPPTIGGLIDCHLFPLREKVASVTSVFKQDEKLSKKNYRPISVLNVFSKVFGHYILNQICHSSIKFNPNSSPLVDLDTVRSMYF